MRTRGFGIDVVGAWRAVARKFVAWRAVARKFVAIVNSKLHRKHEISQSRFA